VSALAIIDTAAFEANVRVLVDRVAPAEVMLAVKADAYGHGMSRLAAHALAAGARSLAVLEIPAALQLRAQGIDAPLFAWLHGVDSDFSAAIDADIELGVSSLAQLTAIAGANRAAHSARVHLKIDTGLHRNGATPEEWPDLVAEAVKVHEGGGVVLDGVWSHLADASPEDDDEAITAFERALAVVAEHGAHPRVRHLAASSAGWREPRSRYDRVRFGIAAYGISPFDDRSGFDLGLRAVMTLTTTVSDCPSEPGTHWIGAGYADGVPVAARDAEVSLAGRRARVLEVGVDRTLIHDSGSCEAGQEVVVFGEPATGAPSAEDWAAWSGTIGDEIVTGVPPRVTREYR